MLFLISFVLILGLATPALAQAPSIETATLAEQGQKTPEISTAELRRILADKSIPVVDSRKASEFVAGHIAGAVNLPPPPGAAMADHVASVLAFLGGDKAKPVTLYCNGPNCRASRMLSDALADAGFTGVKRYQLGLPVWRALSGLVEIEKDGVTRIFGVDRTAVFFDARDKEEFSRGSLPGAHNVPASALVPGQVPNAPFPNTDFNTRIVIFGAEGAQARKVAEAVSRTPFTNASYFPGRYEELRKALKLP